MTELWQWLLTPISGATVHHIALPIAWHGRLMVAAWGVLMPVMVVIARYYKVVPGQDWPRSLDNPFWFVTHRRIGYLACGVATMGWLAILWAVWPPRPTQSSHATLGFLLLLCGWLQVFGSWARGTHGGPMNPFTRQPRPRAQWPGDHFSMTQRRIKFEYLHKTAGWLLMLVAIVTIYTGLRSADAPRWMWLAMAFWWISVLLFGLRLQRQGRCIDTYQAIWGFDPSLPGNQRQPIGWGIRRYTPQEAATLRWLHKKKQIV